MSSWWEILLNALHQAEVARGHASDLQFEVTMHGVFVTLKMGTDSQQQTRLQILHQLAEIITTKALSLLQLVAALNRENEPGSFTAAETMLVKSINHDVPHVLC